MYPDGAERTVMMLWRRDCPAVRSTEVCVHSAFRRLLFLHI